MPPALDHVGQRCLGQRLRVVQIGRRGGIDLVSHVAAFDARLAPQQMPELGEH
jgi:hypothetical protein